MKKVFDKYKHILWILIYMAVYLSWFFILESKVTTYRIIHTMADDKIPFCEFFVIPYYLWFLYVTVCVLLAAFRDKNEYYRTIAFLMTGMTVFLLISTFWPNGHNLRPMTMPRDNICSRMVSKLYLTDTPTNLWPSIHVYNSIGAHLSIVNSEYTKKHKAVRCISLVICLSIICSTMFIKQHSLFDVCTALMMALVVGLIVYRRELREAFSTHSQYRLRRSHI